MRDFPRLVDCVQRNCHIADARHARDMTMCNYLLEMREFFRWENHLPPHLPPPRGEVSTWLAEREALWETLIEESFIDLPVEGGYCAPFAAPEINRALAPQGLFYGAGYGRFGKPHFFLATLVRQERRDGVDVSVCGCEYARDLTAIPAALQGDGVIVRQEALRQWLWEKAEAWGMKRNDGAMKAALAAYGFESGAAAALERMAEAETETLILHEVGEHAAGRQLGADWAAMLAGLGSRHAEVLARSVRDHLADCLVTLPTLLERDAVASLHFWFANLDGYRRQLFPALAAAYGPWRDGGDAAALRDGIARGRDHWLRQAGRLLDLWRRDNDGAAAAILESAPAAYALD